MTVDDVLKYYGSYYAATQAVGVSRQAGTLWKKENNIPILQQYRFEKITGGKLVAKDDMIKL